MPNQLATGRSFVADSYFHNPAAAIIRAAIVLLCITPLAVCEFLPTSPGPGDAFVSGTDCVMKWDVDASGAWNNMTIELMSGSNDNMTLVTRVAEGIDGTNSSVSPFSWQCPDVDPFSTIYFYQFSNAAEKKWTTRFTITSPNGSYSSPSESEQPNGDKIPWGIGHLVQGSLMNANRPSLQSKAACSNGHSNLTEVEQHMNATRPGVLMECKVESTSRAESGRSASPITEAGDKTQADGSSPTDTSRSLRHDKDVSAQSSRTGSSDAGGATPAATQAVSRPDSSSQTPTASPPPTFSTSSCDEHGPSGRCSHWLVSGVIVAMLL